MRNLLILSTALTFSATANAELITFDESAATNGAGLGLTNEYQSLGVSFTAGFAHTYDGISDGDPGGFGIDGDGSVQFLGIRSAQPTVRIQFDSSVEQVSLRAIQGGIPFPTDSLNIVAWNGLQQVDAHFIGFNFGSSWITVNLSGTIDAITISGTGTTGAAAFGIDNLQWTTVPAPGACTAFGLVGLATLRRRRA
ncbi:MAG: hypothetical protein R3B67_10255 [Phycisphaerales bacterium]